jgi:hypothetical protein
LPAAVSNPKVVIANANQQRRANFRSAFSAAKVNSFQYLTARKDSIMQKRKLGNLEVSAIGLGCMSTFQIWNSEC